MAPDWLSRHTPAEWIRAAMAELRRAEEAIAQGNLPAGIAGAKRAAGMAMNGSLIVEPRPGFGRSYVDHLVALRSDVKAPAAVRDACALLLGSQAPSAGALVMLRAPRTGEKIIDAARDVMAHAYAIVKRNEPLPS